MEGSVSVVGGQFNYWKTLKNVGVDGPFLKVIQEMYRNTLCAVKVNNKVTDWFSTYMYAGLGQGQNDSPTAFAAFVILWQ